MSFDETHSFFTPPIHSSHQEHIVAGVYNLAQVLLKRSDSEFLFVPVRTMQYLAIVEANAFWFVDSLAYAVQDGEGGRVITVSWHLGSTTERTSLDERMDCEVVYYGEDRSEIQTRLRGEFHQAMQLMDQRFRERVQSEGEVRILPFKQ